MLRDITRPNIPLIQSEDGILLFQDTTRNKILSVTRENISFGIKNKNITGTRWLQTIANIPSNILGYKIPRNGTITAVIVQTQNSSNCMFEIKKNNVMLSSLYTCSLVNNIEQINDNLNIDINEGDFLQSLVTVNSSNVDYPLIFLEIAWR
jgi:hypothetical protein